MELPEKIEDCETAEQMLEWIRAQPDDPSSNPRPECLAFFIMEQEMLSQRPAPAVGTGLKIKPAE